MLNYHLTTERCELGAADRGELEKHLRRLEAQLRHIDPDLVELDLKIERHARRDEYRGSVRLFVISQVLAAKRNAAPTVRAFLKQAFDDIEEQLRRFKAKLRREYAHGRKRASLSPAAVRFRERELLEERELLDRALAGDRQAFEQLVEAELPGLDRVISRTLAAAGRQPTPEEVQHILAEVLTLAFRELARKPARWSLGGWLAWLARREIAREAWGLMVAQSAERPSAEVK
jgi:ribosome-associated translation inhibitor RaiA